MDKPKSLISLHSISQSKMAPDSRLAEQTQPRAAPHRNAESFLVGKLYDDRGNRMGPSHAAKGERRWRYYISRAILKGRNSEAGSITRVPAAQIEKQVFDAIQGVIASKRSNEGFGALSLLELSGWTISSTGKPCQALSSHEDMLDAIEQVTIGAKQIEIRLSESVAVDGLGRTLTIPWVPPSPYQRRQIIQGKGEPCSPIRPMRVRARAVFTESLRNAHRWLDGIPIRPSS
jgi:site-specific DNA recombinase